MPRDLLFARFRLKVALIALVGFFAAVISADIYGSHALTAEDVQAPAQLRAEVAGTLREDREQLRFVDARAPVVSRR